MATAQGLEVGLVVRDLDTMLRFYRDTLGLPSVRQMEYPGLRVHWLAVGAGSLKLVQPDEPSPAANPPGGLFTATGLRYFTVLVDRIELEPLLHAGGTVVSEGTAATSTFAIVADPEGNHVELVVRG